MSSAFEAPAGIELKTPANDEAIRALHAGDVVYVTGQLWALLDKTFRRVFEEGEPLPIDTGHLNVAVIGGGFVEEVGGKWVPEGITPIPTTATRYYKWVPELINRYHIKAIISKEGLGTDPAIHKVCLAEGVVGLSVFGFPPKLLPGSCISVSDVKFLDNGTLEALWTYNVEHYGPLVVNVDTHGGCLAQEVAAEIERRSMEVYRRRGLELRELKS